jgi:hypothetical protein
MAAITDRPRTHLGPLTTAFTPSPSCSTIVPFCTTCSFGWAGQSCSATNPIDDTACWPPTKTAGVTIPTQPLLGWGFYSPGLACPFGHTAACTATADGGQDWQVQFRLEKGETAIGCCPRFVPWRLLR